MHLSAAHHRSPDVIDIRNHIRRTFANIEQGVREPRSIGPMLREGFVTLWQSRGGGLFGLGYVVTFVSLEVLELPEFFGDLAALFAGDGTLPGSALVMGVDFFVDTLRNMLSAFMWPVWLIQALGGYGVLLLGVGFATFNRFIRPLVEQVLPELRAPDASEENGRPPD